jgi:hypothetical protein
MKRTQFTSDGVDTFRFEFASAIEEFEKKTGLKLDLGRISYNSNQLTTKLTVTIVKEGVNPEDAMNKQSIKENGWKFGLTEADFNKRIDFLGNVYQLKGIKSRKQKYPIVALRQDGQMFKLPARCIAKKPGEI